MECKVTVVIPVFNRQALGTRAFMSAYSQAVEGMEIIVVDDGSQPAFEMPRIDSPGAPVRLIRLESNCGAAAARNAGILSARGAWIALLDSDDYWLPDSLEPRLRFAEEIFASSSDPLIAHAAGFVVCRGDDDRSDVRIPREANTAEEFASGCWFSPGSTILLRKEAYRRIGLLDSGLLRLEDLDWFLRFGLAGGRLKIWNAVVAAIAVEEKPLTAIFDEASRHLREKYLEPNSPLLLPRHIRRRLMAYLDVEYASMYWKKKQWMRTAFHLMRSVIRAPRTTVHLHRFWRKAAAPAAALQHEKVDRHGVEK